MKTQQMPRTELGKAIPEELWQPALDDYYEAPNGCHISMYYRLSSTNGYAYIKTYLAHRAAYTAVHGPIPKGMVVDHTCFTRQCVNPDHLRLLTHFENAQRRHGVDFPLDGRCRYGHAAEHRRIYTYKRAGRELTESRCSECVREQNYITGTVNWYLRKLERHYGLGEFAEVAA